MRISDWSSDVCSSDLLLSYPYGCTEQTISATVPWVLIDAADAQRFGLPVRTRAARADMIAGALGRSGERRVGKEGVSTCRYRWSPDLSKKNTNNRRIRYVINSFMSTLRQHKLE